MHAGLGPVSLHRNINCNQGQWSFFYGVGGGGMIGE